jgi:hypothetical protein
MRLLLIIVCLLLAHIVTSTQAAILLRDQLAGKWKVELVPDEDARRAGEKKIEDTIVFEGGHFYSPHFRKLGFEKVAFEEDTRRGPIAGFKAEAKSKKHGTTHWSGTAMADQIKGEMTWTKPDGTKLTFHFEGSRGDQ